MTGVGGGRVACPRSLPNVVERGGRALLRAVGADAALAVASSVMPKQNQHLWVSHLIQLQTQSTESTSLGSSVINWAILRCGSGS